ncbi:MAG: 16S rRNA (adenine(1518)-N(6)/adenine(1519)-N(6))-dimethyltransferase RsmA [Acholeplasmatales bacterium]|nr:16S rRNA (adenine(1518)-N(6)/adenine(1519)-N(6))-dimethyltransferase RsmA [Acholeplasmatales bacterium]
MQNKVGNETFINNTLKDNNIKAKKKFGQNFLKDSKVLSSIVEKSEVDKETLVIEIGPGLGSLTELLCEKAGFVIAYEIDNDLIPILNDNLSKHNNIEIINKDILEVDINEDINKYIKDYKKVYLVANLPYYITTPIILGLLSKTSLIKRYVMMMQKEVADRLTSKPKTKDYAAITIAIQFRGIAKTIINVPRSSFIPEPNVDSSVIKLDLYDEKKYFPKNDELFFEITRLAFNQRRKTLINNLQNKYNKAFIQKMLENLNYKPAIRAEELDINDFISISDYINENYKEE